MSDRGKGGMLIVPLFIPNQGCPHRCIFCRQEEITGQSSRALDEKAMRDTLDTAMKSPRFGAGGAREVAFFGGTFTGLPTGRMTALLQAVAPYLGKERFHSIRVSTRPDEIDEERLLLMRRFGVATVELGAQSMDDEVLNRSRRGHTARDTAESVRLLREHGFMVGIQLMPGLPGDSEERFMKTVERVLELHPDMVRLYPTVVIKGTELAGWYRERRYRPLQLDEAVKICRESCLILEGHGIPVIRIGLMSSPSLLTGDQILGGPWHGAFGFLVRSAIHQQKIAPYLPGQGEFSRIRLRVPSREIPLVRGYKNQGLSFIEERTGARIMAVTSDPSIPCGQVAVEGS